MPAGQASLHASTSSVSSKNGLLQKIKKFNEGVKDNERPKKVPDVPEEIFLLRGDLSSEDLSQSDCTQEPNRSQPKSKKRTNFRRISALNFVLLGFILFEFAQRLKPTPTKTTGLRNTTDTTALPEKNYNNFRHETASHDDGNSTAPPEKNHSNFRNETASRDDGNATAPPEKNHENFRNETALRDGGDTIGKHHNKLRNETASHGDNDTIAMYIYSNREAEKIQRRKIEQLYSFFKHRLIVVTDETPETNTAPVPSEQIVSGDSMELVTNERLFDPEKCCGRERAMMWLIKHHKEYKHAWIINSDLTWNNFNRMQAAIFDTYRYDNTDLLHENKGMEQQDPINASWWKLKKIQFPEVSREAAAALPPPYHHGEFALYRISSRLATGLDDWRTSHNGGNWTFFVPLLSNWPIKNESMTTKSFVDNDVGASYHEEYHRRVVMF